MSKTVKKIISIALAIVMLVPSVATLGGFSEFLFEANAEEVPGTPPAIGHSEYLPHHPEFNSYWYIPSGTPVVYQLGTAFDHYVGGSTEEARVPLREQGFIPVDGDFNDYIESGTWSYVVAGVKTTTEYSFGAGGTANQYPVTALAVYRSDSKGCPDSFVKSVNGVSCTFHVVSAGPNGRLDLNKGITMGDFDYLYLYYTTDNCGAPITGYTANPDNWEKATDIILSTSVLTPEEEAQGMRIAEYNYSDEPADVNIGTKNGAPIYVKYNSVGTSDITEAVNELYQLYNSIYRTSQTDFSPASWTGFSGKINTVDSILTKFDSNPYTSEYSAEYLTQLRAEFLEAYSNLDATDSFVPTRIVVPETIYLSPSLYATSEFEYYVNNNYDFETKEVTTSAVYNEDFGKWFFDCETAREVKVTVEGVLSADASVNGGETVSLVEGAVFNTEDGTLTGILESGELAQTLEQNGISQIAWTFLWENADGTKDVRTVYTTCYAPYEIPAGAAVKSKHRRTEHRLVYASQFAYWQGVHGISAPPDGIDVEGHEIDADKHFYINEEDFFENGVPTIKNRGENHNPDLWFSEEANGSIDIATFRYAERTNDIDNNRLTVNSTGYTSEITVDKSRYTNLNQIPNLTANSYITDVNYATDELQHGVYHYTGAGFHNSWERQETLDESFTDGSTGAAIYFAEGGEAVHFASHWRNAYDYEFNGENENDETFMLRSFVNASELQNVTKSRAASNAFAPIIVRKVSKEALRHSVNQCILSNYQISDYTEESFNAMCEAFATASEVLGNPLATQAEIDAAREDLGTAIGNLEAYYAVTVEGNGATYNMLFINNYSNSLSVNDGTITGNVNRDYDIDCLHFTGYPRVSGEETASAALPVYAYMQEGHTYNFTFVAPSNNFEAYLVNTQNSDCYACVSPSIEDITQNEDGTYTYSMSFTPGDATSDSTWENYPAVCDGLYQLRFDLTPSEEQAEEFIIDGIYMYETDYSAVIQKVVRDSCVTVTFALKEGYDFSGWNYTEGQLNTNVLNKKYSYTIGNKNATLYASWDATDYTMTYDLGYDGSEAVINSYNVEQSFNLMTPFRNGYDFVCWNIEAPGESNWTEATLEAGAEISDRFGNVTLTAMWEPVTYILTLDPTEGGIVENPVREQHYEDVVELPAASKTGYTFNYWTAIDIDELAEEDETQTHTRVLNAGETFSMPAGDLTLTAVYTVNQYTITLKVGHGLPDGRLTVDYGSYFNFSVDTVEGYTFKGWSDTEGGPVVFPGAITVPAEDTTFYAVWDANDCTVTYPRVENVTFDENNPTEVEYGDDFTFTFTLDDAYGKSVPEVSVTGAEGVTVEKNGNECVCTVANVNGDVSFEIGGIEKNTYTVTFVDGNGDPFDQVSVVHGETAIPRDGTPEKAPDETNHYTFTGWSDSTNIMENTDIIAQFVAEEHDYSGEWKHDEEGHWKECEDCGKEGEKHEHDSNVTVSEVPATETEPGHEAGTACSECGEITDGCEEIPALHLCDIEYPETEGVAYDEANPEKINLGEDFEFKFTLEEGYNESVPVVNVTGADGFNVEKVGDEYVVTVQGVTDETAIIVGGVTKNTYTVTFVDGNGDPFDQVSVVHGETAIPRDGTPEKAPDETNHYTFTGWGDSTNIMENTDIIAQFVAEEHDYSGEWKHDEEGHWKECEDCGKEGEKHTHDISDIPEQPATCTEDGHTGGKVCDDCGAEIEAPTVIPSSGHDFSGDAHSDEEGHWHECENDGCDATTEKEPHHGVHVDAQPSTETEDGHTEGTVCDHCGEVIEGCEVIPAGHNWDSAWYSDGDEHWHKCANEDCHETKDREAHMPVIDNGVNPTCTLPGKTQGSHCSICGRIIVAQQIIPSTGHNPGAPATCTTPQICEDCGAVIAPAHGHHFDGGTTITPATETEDGVERYVCEHCGYTEDRTVSYYNPAVGRRYVKFHTMSKLEYIIDNNGTPYTVYNSSLVYIPTERPVTFNVHLYSNFGYDGVVVYMNGVELTPNANGSYTIPAGGEPVVISASPFVSNQQGGKISLWEMIVNFFKRIFQAISSLFNK